MTSNKQYEVSLKERIEGMVREAYEDGFVFTVSLVPGTPLAMGYYSSKVEVREKRVLTTPIVRSTADLPLKDRFLHLTFAEQRNQQAIKDQAIAAQTAHAGTTGRVPIPAARQAFFDIVEMIRKSRGAFIVLSDKHFDEGEHHMTALMRDGFTPTKTHLWNLLNGKHRSPAHGRLHELLDALYDNS